MKCLFITVFAFTIAAISCSPKSSPAGAQKGGHTNETKNIVDWEAYDPGSTVDRQSIAAGNLQGHWSAYEGAFRFGNNTSTMKLNIPFIVEMKDDSCRRNVKDDFKKFILRDNLLLIPGNLGTDTGIINKLTTAELVISWKRDDNYSRYYYKK